MTRQLSGKAIWGVAIVLAFGTIGCSTKKYVLKTVAPVEARTAELEKQSSEHGSQIEAVQTKVSATDERAMSADRRAQEAAESASKAQQTAEQAGTMASEAQSLAQKGLAQVDEVNHTLGNLSSTVENLDNFQLASSETVQFKLNSSELTKEAESQLDADITKIGSAKHYLIEVEGFTDTTGPDAYNLELSRRRADSVVRYLTVAGKVPLFRVHIVGYGKANPVASNENRKGRQENRRVEIKLFMAEGATAGQQTASANTGTQ